MKFLNTPSSQELRSRLERPNWNYRTLEPIVAEIFEDIKRNGKEALIRYTRNFDKIELKYITAKVPKKIDLATELKNAIDTAFDNIKKFHESQKTVNQLVETTPGVICWQRDTPISQVGLYIPGGSAPLFSTVLMLAVPAVVAGCKKIVLATPPQPDGKIHPAIAYAAKKCGIDTILNLGGIQAIAAMVLGTEETPPCHKIFGPGNTYVTAAKIYAQTLGTAIDMPAGPSEVLVIADTSANPKYVAADLIAQAEHGPDSQVILFTDSLKLGQAVQEELAIQLATLPRGAVANVALESSCIAVLPNLSTCVEWSNYYAPEHLIINTQNPREVLKGIENAGTVFLGNYGCESLGDYATGANHTLPTAGFAKAYSGITLSSFTKTMTVQEISDQGLQTLGPKVVKMAEAEGLAGHANAVNVRLTNAYKTGEK